MTKQELADTFGVSISTLNTNFPLFCKNQLKKGFLITREGLGKKANYTVEKVEKQEVDKSIFSTRGSSKEEIEGEQWKSAYCSTTYEVSNLGRIRNKKTKIILNGYKNKSGYIIVSLDNVNYSLHRLILQSWSPQRDFENLVVDHINGIRSDNRLENLRWATEEENTVFMIKNRKEITKETTRLINKYGYEKTLELLQQIQ